MRKEEREEETRGYKKKDQARAWSFFLRAGIGKNSGDKIILLVDLGGYKPSLRGGCRRRHQSSLYGEQDLRS